MLTSNGIACGAIDGDFLYVGGGDGKVKKVVLMHGQWTLTHEAQLDSKIMSINLSNDRSELIVGTIGGKIYRVLTNDLSFLLHSDAHAGGVVDVAFGKDSDSFVAIDETGCVKRWDLSEYKSTFSGGPPKNCRAHCCAIAKDDGTVMTGWADGFLRCFDSVGRKAMLWEIAGAHRGAITSVYADSNYILTGGQDGAVRVWSR
jgi:cilia- and flagella-associated protein 52